MKILIAVSAKHMNFLDKIINHYLREAHQGLGAAIFGGLLLITAILLSRFAHPLSFLKGLTIPFFLIGLIMGIGGSVDGYLARRSIPEKTALFQKDKKEFFTQETKQVQKTHHSWRRIFIFWSILSVTGLVLLISHRKSWWAGLAIGTIFVSIAGHIEEAISKKFNEKYYHQVLEASKSIDETPPPTQ